jgi:hypothetical protein
MICGSDYGVGLGQLPTFFMSAESVNVFSVCTSVLIQTIQCQTYRLYCTLSCGTLGQLLTL